MRHVARYKRLQALAHDLHALVSDLDNASIKLRCDPGAELTQQQLNDLLNGRLPRSGQQLPDIDGAKGELQTEFSDIMASLAAPEVEPGDDADALTTDGADLEALMATIEQAPQSAVTAGSSASATTVAPCTGSMGGAGAAQSVRAHTDKPAGTASASAAEAASLDADIAALEELMSEM